MTIVSTLGYFMSTLLRKWTVRGGGVAKEGSSLLHRQYLLVIMGGGIHPSHRQKGVGHDLVIREGAYIRFPSQTKISGMVHLHLLVIWEWTYILDTDRDEWGIVHLHLLVIGKGAYIPVTHIDGWGMWFIYTYLSLGRGRTSSTQTERVGLLPITLYSESTICCCWAPDLSVFLVEVQHHQAILGLGCGASRCSLQSEKCYEAEQKKDLTGEIWKDYG